MANITKTKNQSRCTFCRRAKVVAIKEQVEQKKCCETNKKNCVFYHDIFKAVNSKPKFNVVAKPPKEITVVKKEKKIDIIKKK